MKHSVDLECSPNGLVITGRMSGWGALVSLVKC